MKPTHSIAIAIAILLAAPALLAQIEEVYVQTARGSFNHQAVEGLYNSEQKSEVSFLFSGTPRQTFENAAQANRPAFVALRNDLVPNHLIGQTVEAMKDYEVLAVTGAAILPIEMCLLRSRTSVESGVELSVIVSHPAALKQINHWKKGRSLTELEEPGGTSVAAEKVATGKLPQNTGVIASCWLSALLTDLMVIESGIQDTTDNTTLFGRLIVKKRHHPISEEVARKELQAVVDEAFEIAVNVASK